MSDWGVGYAMGIACGLAIAFVTLRKQKRWSELTERERKLRIGLIAAGVSVLAVGMAFFLLR